MRNKWKEVSNPKQDIEYWVVVDEKEEMPHYFKTQDDAENYAEHFGHTIIFQECFN